MQLRQDNKLGTLFNMVGFQTKLRHGEQTRIFRTIPGLEQAEFARLGGLHRNTYLNSPQLLDATLRLKGEPRLRFAGQITGCEGYVESAAMGLMAGRFAAAERLGERLLSPPPTTAHGALLGHITGGHVATIDAGPRSYQPMNVNFGLFPPLTEALDKGEDGKRLRGTEKVLAKKRALCAPRAQRSRAMGRRRASLGRGRVGVSRRHDLVRAGTFRDHAPTIRRGSRAARHNSHCRRHCGSGRGENGSPAFRSSRLSIGATSAAGRNAAINAAGTPAIGICDR